LLGDLVVVVDHQIELEAPLDCWDRQAGTVDQLLLVVVVDIVLLAVVQHPLQGDLAVQAWTLVHGHTATFPLVLGKPSVEAATDHSALRRLWAVAVVGPRPPALEAVVLVMIIQADLTVVVVFVLSDILTLFNY